jgi:hypothetical protein
MRDTGGDIQMTLARLEALLASGVLTQAEAAACAGLADALRRPARVAIIGQSAPDVSGIMRSLIGEDVAQILPGGPAVEVHLGDHPRHTATFEDGSSLSQDGYPPPGLGRYGPLFLQVEAPVDTLASMSFLAMELGHDPEGWPAAMAWAAKRSEIAIFCADGFGDLEAGIWSAAPDRLKNHCYLVITGRRAIAGPAAAEARGLFDAVIHAPAPAEGTGPLGALSHRLTADIALARQEDVDAAELFLHRFRRTGAAVPDGPEATMPSHAGSPPLRVEEYDRPHEPVDDALAADLPEADAPGVAAEPTERPAEAVTSRPIMPASQPDDRRAARALVSGPILHLKRRTRALAEVLEWRDEAEEWSAEVLEHCAETAEALRELVSAWPDDDPLAERLRDAIDRACDTIVLLQVEHGTAQAEDAARILYQLRTDFEQAMAA